MTLPLLGLQAELMTFDPAANSQTVWVVLYKEVRPMSHDNISSS
jgi:hypothetical protein